MDPGSALLRVSVVGTSAAVLVWVVGAPALEAPAGHRIDRFDLPGWIPVVGAVLAIVTASAAAWWPARVVSRVPVTEAISGRPPRPRAGGRPLILAGAVFTAGLAAIALGIDPGSEKLTPLLFLPGLVAVVVATMLLASPSMRLISRLAGRLPVAARLATRDLARYQSRSAAALGAISIAIGIAVAVIAISAAEAPAGEEGNLSDRQLIAWTASPSEFDGLQVPELSAAELDRFEAAARRIADIADVADGSAVVALDVAVDSTLRNVQGGRTVLPIALLGRPAGKETLRDSGRLFVATPALLRDLGLEGTAARDNHVLLTALPGPSYITGDISNVSFRRNPVPTEQVQHIQVPS